MAKFLTVKEAAQLTGKSPSSIRRVIYPVLDNPKHSDRPHIEPSVKRATELRLKGENFAWKISEEFLKWEIPAGDTKGKTGPHKTHTSNTDGGSAAMIEMLRQELGIKNQQIAAQNEVIKGLSERVREGNVLMGSLQQRLSLTDGSSRNTSGIVEAAASKPDAEQGSDAPIAKKTHWLFRKIF